MKGKLEIRRLLSISTAHFFRFGKLAKSEQ